MESFDKNLGFHSAEQAGHRLFRATVVNIQVGDKR